jgi:hypothetical protein
VKTAKAEQLAETHAFRPQMRSECTGGDRPQTAKEVQQEQIPDIWSIGVALVADCFEQAGRQG